VQGSTQVAYGIGMEVWVDLAGSLYTEIIYLSKTSYPFRY